jgi:hypothetical protein
MGVTQGPVRRVLRPFPGQPYDAVSKGRSDNASWATRPIAVRDTARGWAPVTLGVEVAIASHNTLVIKGLPA